MRKPTAFVSLLLLAVVFALGTGASPASAQPDQPTAAPEEPVAAPVGTTPEPIPQAASCTFEESISASLSPIKSDKQCKNACEHYCSRNDATYFESFWAPRTTFCDCRCCPNP